MTYDEIAEIYNWNEDNYMNNERWLDLNRSYTKRIIIKRWQNANPEGAPKMCSEETGISLSTVYKWWNKQKQVK